MPVTINGSTGIAGVDGSAGTPSVQGTDTNTGIFFPAADTIAFAEGGTEAMRIDSSGNVGVGTSSPQVKLEVNGSIVGVITSGTSVASTSGTSIDFTNIPSWAKRITILLNGVSTNGTVPLLFQIGTSSGVETTGYVSSGSYQGQAQAGTTSTSGFLNQNGGAVADTTCGITTLCLFGSNQWIASSVSATGTSNYTYIGAGSKTLSGTLTRVRVTTTNGTDTFDAGSINILYEG